MFDNPSFLDLLAPSDPTELLGQARAKMLRGQPSLDIQAAPQISTAPKAGPKQPAQAPARPQAGSMPLPQGDPLLDQYGALQRRQQQALGDLESAYEPPDTSGLKAYGQQRRDQGAHALFTAMAAQQAGKEFAPVSASFLKQAMAARDPMKVTGGMLTETGDYVADPGYNREANVRRAEARVQRIDSALQSNISAQERRRLEDDRQQAARELKMLTAGIAAGNKADRDADKKDAANERRTDAIRKEYNARLAKVQDGATFADAVVGALSDPGIAKNAPAQVALVMQFGKMLDPDSVVREAEQRMIANARGFADTLQQYIPRLQTGALLTPEQLRQMRDVAMQYRQNSSTRVQDLKDLYTDLAQRNKLPAEDIVLGYGGRGSAVPAGAVRERGAPSAAPQASPAAGPPPGAVRERRP